MIAFLLAVLAIAAQPTTPPPDFIAATLGDCRPIVRPGDFIGCEEIHFPAGEDQAYAGVLWIPAPGAMPGDALVPSLETGP